MPALHRGRRSRGLTLIELLLFIVVVGIALAAMLKVFVTATTASTDPMVRRQQLAIAESLLREVELMPFTWCDPALDPNVDTVANATACTFPENSNGPEGGQTRYGPVNFFNNVNDYNGFNMAGIRDVTNTAIAGLSGYSASVSVTAAALDNIPSAGGDALKITVTVTAPDSSVINLQGWRTRYAPTSPD
ncbi:MAG TPA: type II secretion system protein [Roseateles sp.]